jgi:hypothetical protein
MGKPVVFIHVWSVNHNMFEYQFTAFLFLSRRAAAIARGIPITIGPMIRNSGGSPGIILDTIIVP